jgi:hypothetical protein
MKRYIQETVGGVFMLAALAFALYGLRDDNRRTDPTIAARLVACRAHIDQCRSCTDGGLTPDDMVFLGERTYCGAYQLMPANSGQ